jgi:hypothetical protein
MDEQTKNDKDAEERIQGQDSAIEKEEENAIDKKQQIEIEENKKKINLSFFISIAALIISVIQLVFTSPYFLDAYNKPSIIATEKTQYLSTDGKTANFVFEIFNSGRNTAENVNLRFRCFEKDKIQFMPSEVTEIKSDKEGIPIRNHTYEIKSLVPGESYILFIYSDAKRLAEYLNLDSLEVSKKYEKPELFIGPFLEMVKSEKGFANIRRLQSLEFSYTKAIEMN